MDLFSEQIDAAAVGNLGSVRADTDIEIDRSRLGKERELVAATAWLGGGEGGVGGIDGGGGAGHEKYRPGWDQFSVNERLTGVRSDYSEELYTTKLELGTPSREQRQEVSRKWLGGGWEVSRLVLEGAAAARGAAGARDRDQGDGRRALRHLTTSS